MGHRVPFGVVAVSEAFAAWSTQPAEYLRQHGVAPARAECLATLTVAAADGAIAICRAQRSAEPLDHLVAELTTLFSAAIDQ